MKRTPTKKPNATESLQPVVQYGRAALLEEIEMLKLNQTYWRYDHGEIEAACGGEVALMVREKVMRRRDVILSQQR